MWDPCDALVQVEIGTPDALDLGDPALSARLRSVAAEVAAFRPRAPHHHPHLLGGEAALPCERILARVARAREAIDLAIGEGLSALADGGGLMALAYSKMTDDAREELGLPATTAREKAKLARGLEARPLLREAVRSGRLTPREALEVFPVACGHGEGPWVLLAGTLSVRELRHVVAREVRRFASRAQERLCAEYRELTARGNDRNDTTAAIAGGGPRERSRPGDGSGPRQTFGLARSRVSCFFLGRGWPLAAVSTKTSASAWPGTAPFTSRRFWSGSIPTTVRFWVVTVSTP